MLVARLIGDLDHFRGRVAKHIRGNLVSRFRKYARVTPAQGCKFALERSAADPYQIRNEWKAGRRPGQIGPDRALQITHEAFLWLAGHRRVRVWLTVHARTCKQIARNQYRRVSLAEAHARVTKGRAGSMGTCLARNECHFTRDPSLPRNTAHDVDHAMKLEPLGIRKRGTAKASVDIAYQPQVSLLGNDCRPQCSILVAVINQHGPDPVQTVRRCHEGLAKWWAEG